MQHQMCQRMIVYNLHGLIRLGVVVTSNYSSFFNISSLQRILTQYCIDKLNQKIIKKKNP